MLLIKIFPTTPKAHSNSSEIFSYGVILSEEIIQYSITSTLQVQTLWNQAPRELSKETKNAIWSILIQWISYLQTKQTNNLDS
jgi:hypothetical protein